MKKFLWLLHKRDKGKEKKGNQLCLDNQYKVIFDNNWFQRHPGGGGREGRGGEGRGLLGGGRGIGNCEGEREGKGGGRGREEGKKGRREEGKKGRREWECTFKRWEH